MDYEEGLHTPIKPELKGLFESTVFQRGILYLMIRTESLNNTISDYCAGLTGAIHIYRGLFRPRVSDSERGYSIRFYILVGSYLTI
jgi:hypothetical protein